MELLLEPQELELGSESSAPVPSRVPQVISAFLHPTWWPESLGVLGGKLAECGKDSTFTHPAPPQA